MKYILPVCAFLALPVTAFGQEATADPQVLVHLQIVEVSLTKLRRLGLDLAQLTDDRNAKPDSAEKNDNASRFQVFDDGSQAHQFLEKLLEKLRTHHLMKVLAEPTLVTTSGKPVSFESGDKLSAPGIESPPSTSVRVTVDVLDEQSVRLSLHCGVAETSPGQATRAGSDTPPSNQCFECTTNTKLRSGQTLVLMSPPQITLETENVSVPILGSIPYIGALFGKTRELKNEKLKIISVRTEILQPIARRPSMDNPN
jgi:pilus assembly protein CpaC